MPKSKLYKTLSPDNASSLDDAVAEDPALPPGSTATRARMKSGSYPRTDYSPGHSEERNASVAAGRLPEEVYANTLPWWRAALRRKCVAVVEWESEVIGEWQVRPFLSLSLFPRLAGRDGEGAGSSHVFSSQARVWSPWLRVFCADLDAGHAHVLPRVPARIFLLWVRRSGKRVRAPVSVSLSRIGWVTVTFFVG